MTKTAHNIKTYVIITAKALLTFILGLLIVLGSILRLVFQIVAWPFMFITCKCIKAVERWHLADNSLTI